MKFVFLSYTYSAGFSRPESWLARISMYSGIYECLAKTDHVVAIHQIDYIGEYLHHGVQYHFIGRGQRYFPHQLHQVLKMLTPDIVIVHGLHQPLQLMQLRLTLPGRLKIMVQHHAEKPFEGLRKYLQLMSGFCADAYLFAAAELGQNWVHQGNLPQAKKVHELMEISSAFYPMDKQLARKQKKAQGDPLFLWVGRLNQNKDPMNVVRAFLRYVECKASARLYMIYHTDELLAEISLILDGHVNKNAIIMVGQQPHEELSYWFNAADFFISGSYYEGSGTSVCEAMSCGCIPVVTDIAPFRMITDRGRCGLLYEAGNEEALLEALWATDQMDRDEKRRLCLEYFMSHLSFEAIAGKMRQIAASFF